MLMRVAGRIARLQLAIALAGAAVWALAGGLTAALAALVGGGISAALTFYFAARLGARGRNADPKAVLGAFYRAEMMKLFLGTGLIFTAVYVLRDNAVPLVTTLAATLTAYWFVLLGDID
ncbi:hypothetical protein DEM34_08700 [Spiribacter halobius]|uniref:F0F1 ATP synthase assembly protein I n=2 Tax=Sediminicurvatus halobius TaxID=2182432 RepID=A0A2U2N2V3_9GAMM|nr:hypothetical protein DEM34_08700 [Spiribacter halobius]